MQGSQTQRDVHLLLCQKDKQDKSAAPYLLSVALTCIYIRGQHIILVLQLQHLPLPAYIKVRKEKSLSIKVFGIVNDRTDT